MKTADWTAALRSGNFKQGPNALCKGGSFCCLGVLAEIAEVPKLDAMERITDGYDESEAEIYKFQLLNGNVSFSQSSIPSAMWGIFLEDLHLGKEVALDNDPMPQSLHNRLMTMNDDGVPFNEIADYIDEVVANANQ